MQGLIAGHKRVLLTTALTLVCVGFGAAPALAGTYTVRNTDSTGAGSLAQAITDANADASPPTNVVFAPDVRGTIYVTGGTLVINRSLSIQGPGAGVVDINGDDEQIIRIPSSSTTVSISGLKFVAGSVQGNSSGYGLGGAIYSAGRLTIQNDVFDHNFAGGPGGSSEYSGNGAGGAIDAHGPLIVSDSTFTNNTAGGAGGSGDLTGRGTGGAIVAESSIAVTDSTFADNTAGGADGAGFGSGYGYGGAITVVTGALTLTNSTITGNTASSFGGGLYAGAGNTSLSGDTIDGNTSPGGAGIFSTSSLTINDTLVAGNRGGDNCYNAAHAAGHSNLEGPAGATSCSFDLPSADPMLGVLQDNGGPTETQAPAAGSPAIGAGAASDCPASDQRGAIRPHGHCDVGAYQYAPPVIGTESASSGGTTAENLSADVSNPDVKDGTTWFEYGTSTAYGTSTPSRALPGGATGSSYAATLGGLAPGTVYHFRAVAEDPDGTTYGPDQSFKTGSPVTSPASASGSGSAPGGGADPAAPANTFTFGKARVASNGAISLAVSARNAGRFTSTAAFTVRRNVTVRVHGQRRVRQVTTTYVYGTAGAAAPGAGTVQLVLHLSHAAAAELKKLGHAQVTISVTFTPTGGTARHETAKLTIRRSRKGKYS